MSNFNESEILHLFQLWGEHSFSEVQDAISSVCKMKSVLDVGNAKTLTTQATDSADLATKHSA